MHWVKYLWDPIIWSCCCVTLCWTRVLRKKKLQTHWEVLETLPKNIWRTYSGVCTVCGSCCTAEWSHMDMVASVFIEKCWKSWKMLVCLPTFSDIGTDEQIYSHLDATSPSMHAFKFALSSVTCGWVYIWLSLKHASDLHRCQDHKADSQQNYLYMGSYGS